MKTRKLKEILPELREALNALTLREVCFDASIQEELTKTTNLINDFLRMINPHKRNLILRENQKI